jgi:hypothetical protein
VSGWLKAQYLPEEMKEEIERRACIPLSDWIREICHMELVIIGPVCNGSSFRGIIYCELTYCYCHTENMQAIIHYFLLASL